MFRISALYDGRRYTTRSTATDLSSALSDTMNQLTAAGVDTDKIILLRVARTVGKQTVRVSEAKPRKARPAKPAVANGAKPAAPAQPAPVKK